METDSGSVKSAASSATRSRRCLDESSDGEMYESSADEKENPKMKKKKAVFEYKEAMNRIGSKSSKSGTVLGKKCVDKVIVTESEYNVNNEWLIDDLNKKTHKTNNKRKFVVEEEEEEERNSRIDDEMSNLTFEDNENEETLINNDNDKDIDELLLNSRKSKRGRTCQSPKKNTIESSDEKGTPVDTKDLYDAFDPEDEFLPNRKKSFFNKNKGIKFLNSFKIKKK